MNIGSETLEIMSSASWYNMWLINKINKFIKGNVLEVGCGIGTFTNLLSKKASKITSIDTETKYIKKLQIKKDQKINFFYGNIESDKFKFRLSKYDTIVCMNVLEHIKNDEQALTNMSKLLKKKGYLILLVPYHNLLYGSLDIELDHYRRYSKNDLESKFTNLDLDLEKTRYLNFFGFFGWLLNSRILKKKIIPKNQLKLFDKFFRPFLLLENIIQPPLGLSLLVVAKKK